MTEYELYDLLNGCQQTLAAISVAIVSQQTAFAVAVHLVGQKLKPIVFWILVVCYSVYLYGPLSGFQSCRQRFVSIRGALQALHGITESPPLIANYINVSVFILIWLLTLAYAIYTRRQKTD